MNRLSYNEDDELPWLDPNEELPKNLNFVDIITTDDYITVAQFHAGVFKISADGTPKLQRHPMFGFIDPDDLKINATVKSWRHII